MFLSTKIYHFRDLRQNLIDLRSLRINDLSIRAKLRLELGLSALLTILCSPGWLRKEHNGIGCLRLRWNKNISTGNIQSINKENR